jgi:hypothetical protein
LARDGRIARIARRDFNQSILKEKIMKPIIRRSVLMFAFSFLPLSPSLAQDWWSMADKDFVAQYANLATGTQVQQSQFAWMLFARANQQVTFSGDQQKYSQWELWPSDLDTFSPNAPAFAAASKIRRVPHLQVSRLALFSPHVRRLALAPMPADEEVTRNPISHGYIMGQKLNTQDGIAKFLAAPGAKVDFPLGAIETKAAWTRSSVAGAYQVAGYSLHALHLMVKIAPTPSDPFKDNTPSWFWTTFELKTNQGLSAAQKFETYHDALPAGQSATMLIQAGLGGTAFLNYVSDGQQIQFFDAKNKLIRLGNSKLEWFLATPPNPDPTTWKSWATSCHSCHAQSSGQPTGNSVKMFGLTSPVGALTGADLPPAGYRSLDFVWAFLNAR